MIPLNNDVVALYNRAEAYGGPLPYHYVFPTCDTSHIDAEKPQELADILAVSHSGCRLPFLRLLQRPTDVCVVSNCTTQMNGLESPIAGLRFHDLRHHAITELAESQTSDATIMSIAGQMSAKMLGSLPIA